MLLRRASLTRVFSTSATPEAARSARKGRIGVAVFSGMVGMTGCLSFWQLQRYQWKVKLIEERKEQLSWPPRSLSAIVPDASAGMPADCEFTPVSCEGTFVHSQQILVGPRSAPPGATVAGPPGAHCPAFIARRPTAHSAGLHTLFLA